MTLFQIIQILKEIALTQPNVKTATDGSIYDVMNTNPSVQYDVVHFSQTTHQSDEETDFYGLNIFYVSRLEDSLEDNRLQIQSIGKEVLDNIIRTFCENWGIDFPVITYTPFTQKFNDLCAGCYCNLRLEIPKEIICADDYVAEVVPGSGIKLQDIAITIDRNGITVLTPAAEYEGIGEVRIVTDVPQAAGNFQDKEVEYTENGSYVVRPDPSYDALTSVSVDVLVPDNYDKGYEDGKEDGAEEQKAKMTSLSVTANGDYNRTDGYSAVTVNVPQTGTQINNQVKNVDLSNEFKFAYSGDSNFYTFKGETFYIGYNQGYTGLDSVTLSGHIDASQAIAFGENQQKAKMTSLSVTANGQYNRADGYSAVTVEVPSDYQDGYDDGFEDGELSQKDKMVATSVTENGLYVREDGYSAFLVEVPQAGSNEDLKANLEGRYYLIPEGTSQLRAGAFYRACFETITIPSSVQTIGTFAFAQNQCLTSMTIPDTVLSIGTYIFSGDTNLESVYLGTGLTQIPMYAFATCPSLTGVTFPATITDIGTFVFNTGNTGLEEITFEGLVPPTLASTGNSLGPTGFTFPIYVPCQSIDAYKAAFGTRYATRIQCRQEPVPTAITAFTLVVDTAITDSGTATTTYSPTGLATDIVFTSSNPAVATIDPATGVITVIADGTVTICAEDRISGLQDCKTITVYKSPDLSTFGMAIYEVTSTTNSTEILGPSGSSSFDYLIYNGKRTNISEGMTRFKFSATGRQVVYYHFIDPQTLKAGAFWRGRTSFSINFPLVGFTMPGTVKTIESYAFSYTDLESFVLPKSVATISKGGQEFYQCRNLSSFTFESGSTIQEFYPNLYNTAISTLVIPGNVKEIGYIQMNKSLTSVVIGSGITKIHNSTFANCSNLTTITINKGTPPKLARNAFANTSLNHIYVPANFVDLYKRADGWSEYASIISAKP